MIQKVAVDLEKINETKNNYNKKDWAKFLKDADNRRNEKNCTYNDYIEDFKTYMRALDIKNELCLETSWDYYTEAKSHEFFNKYYITKEEKYFKRILPICKILVLTANPIERAVLHHKVVDSGSYVMVRSICNKTAFFIFKWGKYWVAHIHQGQTGDKDLGTSNTINEALKYFTPNVIISLGIAFGIDYFEQDIGNVLVSNKILPYSDNKREEEDKVNPDRTQDKIIDDWLHIRLENAIGFMDGVTYGDILSGGSVMSSCEEKDRVCLGYTKEDYVIGGEMEGNAVFQFTKRIGIPGVVIKGICDFGIVKNGIYEEDPVKDKKLKESLQAFAMMKTVEKSKPLFYDEALFSSPKFPDSSELLNKYYNCLVFSFLSQFLIVLSGMYITIETGSLYIGIICFIIPVVLLLYAIVKNGWNFVCKLFFKIKYRTRCKNGKGLKSFIYRLILKYI